MISFHRLLAGLLAANCVVAAPHIGNNANGAMAARGFFPDAQMVGIMPAQADQLLKRGPHDEKTPTHTSVKHLPTKPAEEKHTSTKKEEKKPSPTPVKHTSTAVKHTSTHKSSTHKTSTTTHKTSTHKPAITHRPQQKDADPPTTTQAAFEPSVHHDIPAGVTPPPLTIYFDDPGSHTYIPVPSEQARI